MTSVTIDRRTGLKSSAAIKGPCRAATTAPVDLNGEQTIDGVSLVEGDRVLVRSQTDARDNGIYIVSTGNWPRSPDFRDSNDVFTGTQVFVTGGATYENRWFGLTTQGNISIGDSSLVFEPTDHLAVVEDAIQNVENLIDSIQGYAYNFSAESDIPADTLLTYVPGQFYTVAAGLVIQARKEGSSFIVAAADAVDHHIATMGGVKLYRVSGGDLGVVVFYGSSTMAGSGSTDNDLPAVDNAWSSGPNSCVEAIKARFAGRGTFINRSVPGRSMQNLLDNFETEVAAYRPRYLITGSGWGNELPGEATHLRAASYISKAIKLVGLCRSRGITPIWMSQNPINNFSSANAAAQYDIKRALSAIGVRQWDLSAGAALDNYRFVSGLNYDDLHANNAGHAVYATTPNDGDFFAAFAPRDERHAKNSYGVKQSAGVACIKASWPDESRPRNWSVLIETRNDGASDSIMRIAGLVLSTGQAYALRRGPSGYLELANSAASALITSAAVVNADMRPHQHVIAYNSVTDTIKWWMDGSLVGSASAGISAGVTLAAVTLGGYDTDGSNPATGLVFQDLRAWSRNMLADSQIGKLWSAWAHPTEGIIIDADLTRQYNAALGNLAGRAAGIELRSTGSYVGRWSGENANGKWFIDPVSNRLTCTHRINLGSAAAIGDGTYSSPYRTNAQHWTFPMAFIDPPALAAHATPDATGLTSGAYNVYGVAQDVTTTQAVSVQGRKTSSDGSTADVWVSLTATGSFR